MAEHMENVYSIFEPSLSLTRASLKLHSRLEIMPDYISARLEFHFVHMCVYQIVCPMSTTCAGERSGNPTL